MEFGTIQDEVESWLIDLPTGADTRVPGWINEAIRHAAQRHNFNFMATQINTSTTPDTTSLIVRPDDWKMARQVPYMIRQDGSSKELGWTDTTQNRRTFDAQAPAEGNTSPADQGEPRYVHIGTTHLFVSPMADDQSDWDDGNYRVSVPYFDYPDALSAEDDTNWLTERAPYFCIWKATAIGFLWNRDEDRSTYYDQKAEIELARVIREDKLALLPPNLTLSVVRDVYSGVPRRGLKV